MRNSEQPKADDAIRGLMAQVPKAYAVRFIALVGLTDGFCDAHLNSEYKDLCREMAVAVCQKGSQVLKGKTQGWAAGIVYALGRVNFLGDPSQRPHMKSIEIAEGFGVSVATMQAKAKVIHEGLDLMPFHPGWSLPSRMDDNPLVWMLEVNGLVMDIRMAPREAQVAAYEKGLIPYLPAERNKPIFSKGMEAALSSLPSSESAEGMLRGLLAGAGNRKPNAVDEAQEVMYDAWEADTRQRAVALAKKALKISPDCADAYVLLAEETATTLKKAIDLYRKGVEAGERALGENAFVEDVGNFWGLLETRPYMRARASLAQSLWDDGQREEAVEHYRDMLRLNPDDNQGIRYYLMPCLIRLGREEEAEKLYKQYKKDFREGWTYSRALLDFRKEGDSKAAEKSLKAAIEKNKHVPPYLLGRKKLPVDLPDFYGLGDDNEAVIYASYNKAAWEITPGALEWLAARVK